VELDTADLSPLVSLFNARRCVTSEHGTVSNSVLGVVEALFAELSGTSVACSFRNSVLIMIFELIGELNESLLAEI